MPTSQPCSWSEHLSCRDESCECICHEATRPADPEAPPRRAVAVPRRSRSKGVPQGARGRGRPPKPEDEKLVPLKVNVPPVLRTRIEEARRREESLSEVAVRLLEKGLEA